MSGELKVVVAVPIHCPLRKESTNPGVGCPKKVEVAIAVGTALPDVWLATTVLAACVASCESASVPEIVESVDVAPEYNFPLLSTPNPPAERYGNQVFLLIVTRVVVELSNCEVEDAESETIPAVGA